MNSIKVIISLSITCLCFLSSPLKAITSEELQEFAIQQNDAELLEILMKYGDSDSYPVLISAMTKKDYFAVVILVEYGVDINSRAGKEPPYRIASSATLDSHHSHRTVLEMAIQTGETSLVEYFLLNKADPTEELWCYQETPITKFVHETHKWITTGHSRRDLVTTAVYNAIMLDRLDVLILFAHYGADLNTICYEELTAEGNLHTKTPLQLAVERKKKDIVAFLLSIGVDI